MWSKQKRGIVMEECHYMNKLSVKRIPALPMTAEGVGEVLDAARIGWQKMEHANWSDRYPYVPEVNFRIAHTGDHILLQYQVTEEAVRFAAVNDGGAVWEDSCCEFFIHDADTLLYNNVECNCMGTLLMAVGRERNNRQMLSSDEMRSIKRWSSLCGVFRGQGRCADKSPDDVQNDRQDPYEWTLMLIIPVSLLFDHRLKDISGMSFRTNFYKCGDLLPHPHFLSWNAVNIPQPDFHRPDQFGMLTFD